MSYLRRQGQSPLRWRAGAACALVASAATAGATVATTASPAAADNSNPPPGPAITVPLYANSNDLNQIKREAARWISERLGSLNKEISTVNGKSYLGGDGASLVSEMQSDITGLQALGAKIAGDTTVQEAKADALAIFTQFRVYLLMLPVSAYVMSVDYADNVQVPYLNNVITFLQDNENANNQAVIGPLVTNMQGEVQIATNATSGLSAQLLAFTPAQRNSNQALLNGPWAQIKVAARAVDAALSDGQEGYKYLEHHHVPPTTSTTGPTTTTTAPTTTTTAATTTTTAATTTTTAATTTTTAATTTTTAATTTTTSGQLGAIQARAAQQVQERVNSLQATIKWVQGLDFLGSDGATLTSGMQSDITGLEALGSKIAADTSVSTAKSDAGMIFSQFRVYDLVIPVAHAVASVDSVVNVQLPAVQKHITTLQGLENPTTQPVLGPLVANMGLQVQTATNATNGLSAQLQGFTAAQWGSNPHLLSGPDATIFVAQRAVRAAQRDFSRAEQWLRNLDKRHHRR